MKLTDDYTNHQSLYMPDNRGRFHLYSDTSKFAMDSALNQIHNGQLRVKPYVSRRMPTAAQNYPISELEMCGLAINVAHFSHLLEIYDFDTMVDHLGLKHIMKSKSETTSTRIKRVLEVMSS